MKPTHCLLFIFTIIFASCQNNNHGQKELADALSDTTSITGRTGDSIKLVKTADINFQVKDLTKSTREVSGLAKNYGGMVFHQNLTYDETARKELKVSADSIMLITVSMPQAYITVRVPSGNLESFINDVTDLGYFTRTSKLDIDDQSLVYLENVLKQKNRTAILSKTLREKSKPLTDLQAIGVKDDVIDQDLKNRTINANANYSNVTLALAQSPVVRKDIIANYAVSEYNLPFAQRLGQSMKNGWEYFVVLMLAVANLWVFILVGGIGYIIYRQLLHKRRLPLLIAKIK